jgi:DNA-binding transcriptional LysR family regulator
MPTPKIDWEGRIGRRVNLRHLHVFFTVVERKSMAKAAAQLGVSQPTVSEIIGDLEHAFGLRLLDRGPHGVEPTMYGSALFGRIVAVFDELKQSSRDLEFLANPSVGEIRIGYQQSVSSTLLVPAIRRFATQYPRVTIHVDDLPSAALQLSELRTRKYDCTFQLLSRSLADEDDLNVEVLFNEQIALAVDVHNPLANRRKVDLADLVDEPWIVTPPGTWVRARLEEAFRGRGLPIPTPSAVTMSVPMYMQLISNGPYIAASPRAHLRAVASRFGLKELPLDLHDPPWPMVVVTLRHRTLSPIVERFLACAREIARSIARETTGSVGGARMRRGR